MNLLLFDFDGVLVDSIDVYEKTVTDCLQQIGQPLTRGREEFLELFEGNFYESLVQKGVDMDKFTATSIDILARINYAEMKPFDAIRPVLRELKKNHPLVVISSNDTPTIREALRLYDFNGIFDDILGSDFMLSKTEKILYVVQKYNVEPHNIYYIGDTTGDIKEGKQAGIKTVGVTWGWHSKVKMAGSNPDYLFDHPQDLLNLN
ncbi:MAG: Phosphoglycolate phosphatase [Deltaproteobacteria bacterium ADurb.Bin151]|jgi:phosphoglycolate phosphatase|nr:HAD family hydrolase [Smithella sp.]OQB55808.1 MAG: Phosphoglycolate phosphatase [Deltaproteobacteria bacterium ADurb.Bin151]HNZ11550.1 HAD family hydrolase [Smithellaceae bacterium]HOG82476.1 HAD family hydrolase [Smithellaceae bacterium]HQP26052.1 HAD family hydrolase [Smithellaceae bacterium]